MNNNYMTHYQNILTGEIISVWEFIDRLPVFGEHGGDFESGFVRVSKEEIGLLTNNITINES